MARTLPNAIQQVADHLVANDGYLWSTLRCAGVTCQVCTREVEGGAELCRRCHEHRTSGIPIADQVGTLIYALYGEQSYHLVKNYKADAPGPSLGEKMESLLAVGLPGHAVCAVKIAGVGTDGPAHWAVVPSLSRPDRPQPLRELVSNLATRPGIRMQAASSIVDPRALNADHFVVDPDQGPPPPFVFLVEDSWVGGGHAQSAAAALKQWGVSQVAIFTVARVLDPSWPSTAEFIEQQKNERVFDPLRCPWTDGPCP